MLLSESTLFVAAQSLLLAPGALATSAHKRGWEYHKRGGVKLAPQLDAGVLEKIKQNALTNDTDSWVAGK